MLGVSNSKCDTLSSVAFCGHTELITRNTIHNPKKEFIRPPPSTSMLS